MFKKTFVLFGLCGLFATASYAEDTTMQPQKHVVFVQLDSNPQKAHEQLALLKNLDVLGVNRKTREAEVLVTTDELNELKAAHLSVFSKFGRTEALSTALDGYLNPTQVRDALTVLNQKYPNTTHVFEIGKTHRDLPIMAVEVSSQPGDSKRPVVLFNAMHHAREVMTTEIVLHMANVLTEQYGKDPEITNWMDHYRIVLVPQVNPDGNTLVHQGQTMWRKNAYQVNGSTMGVDLNRNYPGYWNYCSGSSGSPSSETFRGPSAGSEPETQAIMNLVATLKPVADISYHSYSELIIYPYGCSNVKNPSKDLFRKVALEMKAGIRDDADRLNTYAIGTAPELLYNADGSDLDWQWKEHGVVGYTIEVNASNFRPDYKKWRDVTLKRQEGGWKALLRQMQASGFRAFVQSDDPSQVTYAVKKQSALGQFMPFDVDDAQKTFSLKSQDGLLYQMTEPGEYQVSFYNGTDLLKTIDVHVENENVDLGTIVLN